MNDKKTIDMLLKISFEKGKRNARHFFEFMPYILNRYNFVQTRNYDYVLYNLSCKKGDYKRIFYSAENTNPPLKRCDWAFTYKYDSDVKNERHFRLPNYVRLGAGKDLIKNINVNQVMKKKTKFCAFIYRHNVPFRNNFFSTLSKYKRVDAPGKSCNNMMGTKEYVRRTYGRRKMRKYAEKLKFLEPYKFCIAFENVSSRGYTTEKLYHAMLANCIPIYWGNPLVRKDFNQHSFVNAHRCKSKNRKHLIDYLMDQIIKIDQNDDLYKKILNTPWYNGNKLSKYVNPKRIIERFDLIFNS